MSKCHFEDEIKSKRRNKIDLHFHEATWKGSKIHRCQLISIQLTIQVKYKHGENMNTYQSASVKKKLKARGETRSTYISRRPLGREVRSTDVNLLRFKKLYKCNINMCYVYI